MSAAGAGNKRLWIVLILVGVLAGVGVGVAIGWRSAMGRSLLSRQCMELQRVDLEVSEIVSLKERWKAYRRSSDPEATVSVSPTEATFLVRGESDLGIWLAGRGSTLEAKVTVPAEGGCYNIEYVGGVQVREGLALLDPEKLHIAGQDLTALAGLGGALGSARQAVGPDDLEDPHLKRSLANIERMDVVDGQIRIRFVDPDEVWR